MTNQWPANAENPAQPVEAPKKPWYKKWWVWLIAAVVIIGIAGSGGNSDSDKDQADTPVTSTVTSTQAQEALDAPRSEAAPAKGTSEAPVTEEKEKEADVPKEYKNALRSAKSYSDMMHMSKQGIYDQLTSEYGDQFSPEAAQYAVDNLKADYKKNALESARNYEESMAMSPSAIYDQLVSEYGEKFTAEEAQYAVDNL
ncbi:Ltp family lipoprotein [Corynebacterium glucuronolyticum]